MTTPTLAELAAQQYRDYLASYAPCPRQVRGEVTYVHAGKVSLTIHPGCAGEALQSAQRFLNALIEDLAK